MWPANLFLEDFQFRAVTPDDLSLLHRWLNARHVAKYWGGAVTHNQVAEKLGRKMSQGWQQGYVVYYREIAVGYLAVYRACKVGEGWWPDEPCTTVGIDVFIGEEQLLGIGLGSQFLRVFTDWLLKQKDVERVIADPHPRNTRAIHTCENAGFREVGVVQTPAGDALLMERTDA